MYTLSDACDTCSRVRMTSILPELEEEDLDIDEIGLLAGLLSRWVVE